MPVPFLNELDGLFTHEFDGLFLNEPDEGLVLDESDDAPFNPENSFLKALLAAAQGDEHADHTLLQHIAAAVMKCASAESSLTTTLLAIRRL